MERDALARVRQVIGAGMLADELVVASQRVGRQRSLPGIALATQSDDRSRREDSKRRVD